MKPGDQIAYLPPYVSNNLSEDIEFGFVTSHEEPDIVFCRFWVKGQLGILRTRFNSEGTPAICVKLVKSVPQSLVDFYLKGIKDTQEGKIK